jgi:hypothetical protein
MQRGTATDIGSLRVLQELRRSGAISTQACDILFVIRRKFFGNSSEIHRRMMSWDCCRAGLLALWQAKRKKT